MSFLRGSANYVWCTTSVLGKGATGAVFQVRLRLINQVINYLIKIGIHFEKQCEMASFRQATEAQ